MAEGIIIMQKNILKECHLFPNLPFFYLHIQPLLLLFRIFTIKLLPMLTAKIQMFLHWKKNSVRSSYFFNHLIISHNIILHSYIHFLNTSPAGAFQ